MKLPVPMVIVYGEAGSRLVYANVFPPMLFELLRFDVIGPEMTMRSAPPPVPAWMAA